MPKKLQRVTQFLTGASKIALTDPQVELYRLVRESLPAELATHCLGVSLKAGRLTLLAPSPAWASRLRYHAALIRAHLERAGVGCDQVVTRVIPPITGISGVVRHPVAISVNSARLLVQTAEHIADPDLAAALRRLASHARR